MPEPAGTYSIEAFDPDRHNRTDFGCGLERIDNYLKRTARKHQDDDFTRLFVAVRPGLDRVLGYYTLNAHNLIGDGLPDALSRRAPRYGIPAAYLSMLSVDRTEQGQGLGRILLVNALRRLLDASGSIGLKALLLDIVDDDGPEAYAHRLEFYQSMGFLSFPDRESRMLLLLDTIREAFTNSSGAHGQ
jgi:GNAT superfamily N-acetyltransferase